MQISISDASIHQEHCALQDPCVSCVFLRAACVLQVDAAMVVLYRLVAGWLLGPLALACVPALEAVAAFLHYLTVDDTAYA
jgi:hypothetical protein